MARGFKREDKPDVTVKNVELKHRTEKAMLIILQDGDRSGEEVWLPVSQIREDHKDTTIKKKGDKGDLVISDWIAGEKGLKPEGGEEDGPPDYS
jgi:hypothetical protein